MQTQHKVSYIRIEGCICTHNPTPCLYSLNVFTHVKTNKDVQYMPAYTMKQTATNIIYSGCYSLPPHPASPKRLVLTPPPPHTHTHTN